MYVKHDIVGNDTKPFIVESDFVYVKENIKKFVPPDYVPKEEWPYYDNMWTYDEVVYTKDEFIDLITRNGEQNTKDITDTQIGLAEAYEYTDGAYTEVTDLQNAVVELYEMIIGE